MRGGCVDGCACSENGDSMSVRREIAIAPVVSESLDGARIVVTSNDILLEVFSHAGESGTCRLRDVLETVAADVELHRMLVDALRPARG